MLPYLTGAVLVAGGVPAAAGTIAVLVLLVAGLQVTLSYIFASRRPRPILASSGSAAVSGQGEVRL